MSGIKLIKAQPPKHLMKYRRGKLVYVGPGLSFFYSTPGTSHVTAAVRVREESNQDMSALLRAWHDGDDEAFNRLMPLASENLHRLAGYYMRRERRDHILQATDLVNEAAIKLIRAKNIDWQDGGHFIAVSAKLMRRILIDFARSNNYQKRKLPFRRINRTEQLSAPLDRNLSALDDALGDLSILHPQTARVVKMKFLEGLTVKEIAAELQISPDRVKQEWKLAKRWLYLAMNNRGKHGSRSLGNNTESVRFNH
jgi:RNA polymerase sigma factor (TIGR02999 family)